MSKVKTFTRTAYLEPATVSNTIPLYTLAARLWMRSEANDIHLGRFPGVKHRAGKDTKKVKITLTVEEVDE